MTGRRPRRTDPADDRLPRALQIALGLVLGVVTLVPAVITVGAVALLIDGRNVPTGLGGLLVAGPFASWTALLTWRLLSGRERRGGGLVPPWMVFLTGGVLSGLAVFRRTVWGFGWERSAAQTAEDAFDLARARRRTKGRPC